MFSEGDSDETLMRQVARGNRDQLEVLVRRYASPLLTFIQRMVGDRHRSEDLFQEVFLRVWTKRRLYEFPRAFKPWLYQIAVNCCRADFRGRHQPLMIALEDATDPLSKDTSPADVVVARETATHVLAAVGELPQQQRMVAVLRIWNDMSYVEIAEIIGRTESTVRSTMHYALGKIRKYLERRLD